MKIALIGPGIMPIPPPGWGAVEILIWDYYIELTRLGHQVQIINTKDVEEIIRLVNIGQFEFVHLHYDVYYYILEHLQCPMIAITSHYPYIDQPLKHRYDGYFPIFEFLVNQTKYYNFVLADKDMQTFLKYGANSKYIKKIKNGIDSKSFAFLEMPVYYDKTIYLGKITSRKNQAIYQTMTDVDFVGNCDDPHFQTARINYLGEWSRYKIHSDLTKYSNLILLSTGEADPLVVKEALIAGLGVVINKSSAENLDTTKDFITIIEDNKMNDIPYIDTKIKENRAICRDKRKEIQEYGITHFDISIEVEKYISMISDMSNKDT